MWFKDRRIGRFEIDLETIDEHSDIMCKIMGSCIVIKAEFMIARKAIEYHAICAGFDELEAGEYPAPTYDVEYDQDTGEISWAKQIGA